jgi:hypothetical protein
VPDSRTGKRFPLQLSTTIRGGKSARKLLGTTTDLSAAGVHILADGDFEIGSKVQFDITLPAKVIGARRDVEIRCQGRVVRAERGSARNQTKNKKGGLACVIDNYEFVRKA